ncbi:MAG: fasciclin domain-containing protein, partial [Flavobacteriaceae bacterium]|nr:fasciclin domain-containing protein [Flavobacteriaceae bacterium]
MSFNIVQTAQGNSELSTLVTALQAADGDLVSILSGNGPFTVLAPTNAAFNTFLQDNNFSSLSDIPTDVLSQVLLNHVITGEVPSSALAGQGSGYAKTNAMGAGDNYISLYFDTSNGVKFNNSASVIDGGADVSASNGIVHVIDRVIALPSVVDHALANSNFSNLTAALGAADGDLVGILSTAGPFTVLAPGNMAFGEFLSDNNFGSLGDVPTDALASVLLNHVVSGAISSTDLVNLGSGYTNTSADAFDGHKMSIYYNTDNGVEFNGKSMVTT